jgi:hypothetical protein
MRARTCLFLGLAAVLFGIAALAQGHGRAVPQAGKGSSLGPSSQASSPGHHHPHQWTHARSPYFNRGFGFGSRSYRPSWRYTYSPYGLQSYDWSYFDTGYYGSPYTYAPQYTYSDYFPYLYFFDLYSHEAQRSKEEADRYEAAFAGKGPAGAAGDAAPLSPRDVVLTIDGGVVTGSASGSPVVVGSGRHTLRISARSSTTSPSTRPD